ncbi:MAG: AAA family ATPase [Syntrophorhabdaceae bacterium]|nr:AAA family ATPase [Syntrophorhabdaceae bacterium]
MYLNYYGLKREPFHITPDPDFLFLSDSHKQALASMMYAIEKKKGFAAITGGVGVGKTTVLRSYLEKMDHSNLKLIYIFNPNIPFKTLVAVILQELGAKPITYDISDMVQQLHLVLIDEYSAGRDVVVIIDEAQNMPVETLENLRMLSNLETSTDKLIQIILIGQTEFDEILNKFELRQLKQRIAIRATITPLSPQESLAYIKHRLMKAGMREGQLYSIFTKSALNMIIEHSKGIPRVINILCDNALITGFGHQEYPITTKTTREVINDFSRIGKKKEFTLFKWEYAALATLLLILSVFLMTSEKNPVVTAITEIIWNRTKPNIVKEDVNLIPRKIPIKPASETREDKPVKKEELKEFDEGAVVKIVGKGENLFQLIEDVYGIRDRRFIDRELIELLKKSNPHIKDFNSISAGEKIIFPRISKLKDSL